MMILNEHILIFHMEKGTKKERREMGKVGIAPSHIKSEEGKGLGPLRHWIFWPLKTEASCIDLHIINTIPKFKNFLILKSSIRYLLIRMHSTTVPLKDFFYEFLLNLIV